MNRFPLQVGKVSWDGRESGNVLPLLAALVDVMAAELMVPSEGLKRVDVRFTDTASILIVDGLVKRNVELTVFKEGRFSGVEDYPVEYPENVQHCRIAYNPFILKPHTAAQDLRVLEASWRGWGS